MMAVGYNNHSLPALIAGSICALTLAILTLSLNLAKILIIISTSLSGASTIIAGILLFLRVISLNDALSWSIVGTAIGGSQLWSYVWLALAIVGILVQLGNTRCYERDYARAQFYASGGRKVVRS
jgi:hypothetical protein